MITKSSVLAAVFILVVTSLCPAQKFSVDGGLPLDDPKQWTTDILLPEEFVNDVVFSGITYEEYLVAKVEERQAIPNHTKLCKKNLINMVRFYHQIDVRFRQQRFDMLRLVVLETMMCTGNIDLKLLAVIKL